MSTALALQAVMRHSTWLIFSLGCMLGGCVAQEPSVQNTGTPTDDMKPGAGPIPTPPDSGILAPPVLDPVQQLTSWDSVPVHGTARPGTSVLIQSSNGDAVAASVASTGRFCVDAPLQPDGITTFDLHTIDENGKESDVVHLSVTQQGTPTQQPRNTQQPENAALHGSAAVSFLTGWTDAASVVDGSEGTWVAGVSIPGGATMFSLFNYDRVMVQLANVSPINHIVAKPTSDCPITAPFELWVTASQSASDPTVDPNGWSKVKDFPVNGLTGGLLDLQLPQPALVGTIALIFHHGYYTSPWSDDLNCGGLSVGWHPYYGFSEIEAWTAPNAAAPPPPAKPTCTTGY